MGDSDVIAQSPHGELRFYWLTRFCFPSKKRKNTVKLKINVEISSIRSSYKENFRTHSREQAARHTPSQVSYIYFEKTYS